MSDEEDFMMSDEDSYEFEYDDDDDEDQAMDDGDAGSGDDDNEGGDADDENSAEVLYYKAKDLKNDDGDAAIAVFKQIVDLPGDGQELLEYKFKSIKQQLKILFKMDRHEEFTATFKELFKLDFSSLQRGYVEDSYSRMLDGYSLGLPAEEQLDFLNCFIENYDQSGRLSIKANLKKIQILLDMGKYDLMLDILHKLYAKLETTPELTRNTYLLELYAIEIQVHSETNNIEKLKELYKKTLLIQGTLPHPRINAIIKECGGKMFMRDENYEQASNEFYDSFKNYDEVGNQVKRIKVLKYLIVSSILSDNEINKFESQETKFFLKDKEISNFIKLLKTFETLNHNEFEKIYSDLIQIESNDGFLIENLKKVEDSLRLKILIHYIKPFKRVSLEKLSETLKISIDSIEDIFLNLKNNDQIPQVRLDLIEGILYNEY